MSEITILHLSDIHFKKKKEEEKNAFRRDVQQKLVDAVKAHTGKGEHGSPDVVAVTGDIAFSGKKNEYDKALEFFNGLKAVLPGKAEFLVVPGNHDVDRDKVDKYSPPYYVVENNLVDEFLAESDQVKSKINKKFNAFRSFARQLNPSFYKDTSGYFQVKHFPGKKISLLVLNSAWASEGDNDRFNIALGFQQLQDALEEAKSIPNRIVLMHHPPFNWLKDFEYEKTRVEMFKKCQLLLHGHTHAHDALVFQDPSDQFICLGANASYTDDKKGFIGFQFLEVKFIPGGTSVKVWPYIFDERRNEFVPDRERWRGQEGKPYFVIEAVEAKKKKRRDQDIVTLQIPEDYKTWVREFHSVLPVDQLARKGEVVMISLPAVYIPLETANPFHKPADEKDMKKGDKEDKGEPKEPSTIDIEQLMERKHCLLLRGMAGMGKTTLVKHLAYSLTHGSGPAALRGYLPVLVFLKDLWPIYKKKISEGLEEKTFDMLLADYFEKQGCPLSIEAVQAFLSHNRALVLLDGLDEVPESIRGDLVNVVHRFQFQHKTNRFLITGRPHGIEGGGLLCFGSYLRDIEPLDEKKSSEFITRWFRAVSGQAAGVGALTAGDLIDDIRQHEHAAIFTENPLLLTALCIFYLAGGKRIPDQRADLYDRIVGNLLYRRFHDPADTETVNRVREFLMHLAFTMHSGNTKSIDADVAIECLKKNHPQQVGESPHDYKKRMQGLFNRIEPVCGLLNRPGGGEIEFIHLSFQEFLAAKHILDRDIDYKKYLEDPWWKETILLYTGLTNLEMKKRSNNIVKEILDSYPEHRIHLLGAEALRDFQSSKREETVVELAMKKLLNIIQANVELDDRFKAGEILGALGDPRIEPLSPSMVMVEAGEFTRGADDEDSYDDEKPVRRIYLKEYMIGKYPVTNREFKAFMDDEGYNNEGLWTPGGWQWRKKESISEPLYWRDRKWNGANFPVVGVSWYEASAYAEWLSRKKKDKYVLPTEAQWEKAARGSGGFSYPWGNTWEEKENRCNWFELGLRRTSPVGIFPAGASPYGCMDMAGNVLEWCADWFGEDYYKKSPDRNPVGPKDGSRRVIRGGGWGARRDCRAACRGWGLPVDRFGGSGFRLARLL